MPTVKRRSVGDTTLQLKRYKTDRPGKEFEYYVTDEQGSKIGKTVYTRREGMERLREEAQEFARARKAGREQALARQEQRPSLPDFGDRPAVSGEVSIPGLGPVDSDVDGDTNDDDQPSLPFF